LGFPVARGLDAAVEADFLAGCLDFAAIILLSLTIDPCLL
jgi:hypothetical protein